MGKRSFTAQESRNGGGHNPTRTRGEFLDILPLAGLGASERRRIEAIVAAVCPGADIVGASVPGRSWDVRPVVVAKTSKQKSQSLIRLFGPEVTLSVGLTELIGTSLEQISRSRPRSALLIEHGTFDGQYWLRRSIVPETLAERLSHGAQLSFAEALRIGRGLIETVTKMHAQGVIHGHISPSNVYTSPSGEVGLIDPLFGLAVIQASHLLQMSEMTAGYDLTTFAPECQRHDWPGVSADIFGIGKVFWSLFSKVHRGNDSANLAEMSASQLRAIREIILEMTDQEPHTRLSFEEVIERFDEFESDMSGSDGADLEEIYLEHGLDSAPENGDELTGGSGRDLLNRRGQTSGQANYAGTASFSHEFIQNGKQLGEQGSEVEEQPGRFATAARILRPGGISKRSEAAVESQGSSHRDSQRYSQGESPAGVTELPSRRTKVQDVTPRSPGSETRRAEAISEVFFSAEAEEQDAISFGSDLRDESYDSNDLEDLSNEFDPQYSELSESRRGNGHRSNRELESVDSDSTIPIRPADLGRRGEESLNFEDRDTVSSFASSASSSSGVSKSRTSSGRNEALIEEEPDNDRAALSNDTERPDHGSLFDDRIELPEIDDFDFVDHVPVRNDSKPRAELSSKASSHGLEKKGSAPRTAGEVISGREKEMKFAPKPQRSRQTEHAARPRSRTETLTNLIAQLQRQQSRRWMFPAGVFAVGLIAAYFTVYPGMRDRMMGDSVYSSADLRAAWQSGLASRMAAVADAAVSGGESGHVAEEILVSSVLANDKGAEVLGGGAALLRIAFDKRWEMALSPVDRRQAIRLATAKLLGDKAYRLEGSLDSLHPGVILALTATAQESAISALNTIHAANLRALPPPIGPAFAELGRDNPDLRCGDQSVRELAQFATIAAPEPIEIQEFLADEQTLVPRLRALAVLAGHDQNSASMMLGILLAHPNIQFKGELFTWAEVSKLTDWQRFDAADQLFVLAGIPPSKEPMIEHIRWMRGHPAAALRRYALEQTLDRVKLNHPAGLEILTALKEQPTALSAIQTYDLALVLENPKSVTVDQAKKWLQSSIPPTVLERMVIAASSEPAPSVVDMEVVNFLEQSTSGGWNPAVEILQKVSSSPQKYFRLLAMAKIYRLQNRGLAQQLLSSMLEKEVDAELKDQLEAMIQILQTKPS